MMQRQITISILILGAIVALLIFGAIRPVFSQIQKSSQELISQKKEILESNVKIQNLQQFRDDFKKYQQNLEKISALLVNAAEPVAFIEFLESEAAAARLSIEIAPPVLKSKDGDLWPSLGFNLNTGGDLPALLKFIERLESAPYLLWVEGLSIRKPADAKKAEISAALLIKVYAK